MEMYERIKEVEEMPSQYAIVKRSYLSRGDSPWPKYLANLIFMHHVIIKNQSTLNPKL